VIVGAGMRDERDLEPCAGGCCKPGEGLYPHELDDGGYCASCRDWMALGGIAKIGEVAEDHLEARGAA